MSNQPTIQFSKPLRVNLHRDMTPPKVKIECGDIVVADCIGNPDHAERIAACVNACAGIADPHAAIQVIQELRDALQAFIDADDDCEREFQRMGMPPPEPCPIRERMVASLVKAKEVLP
jgi:hypothetical protein